MTEKKMDIVARGFHGKWIKVERFQKVFFHRDSREEMRRSLSIGNRPHPPAPIAVFRPFLDILYLSQN